MIVRPGIKTLCNTAHARGREFCARCYCDVRYSRNDDEPMIPIGIWAAHMDQSQSRAKHVNCSQYVVTVQAVSSRSMFDDIEYMYSGRLAWIRIDPKVTFESQVEGESAPQTESWVPCQWQPIILFNPNPQRRSSICLLLELWASETHLRGQKGLWMESGRLRRWEGWRCRL